MKITRLSVLGFKSFVDPTDIVIEPGLTGVVGPNGCGKSNLVEALRFVMGESSYKAMRGGGMDDVIFAGSGRRPSRNTAEVTLTAVTEILGANVVPLNEAGALEITRRIERDAGSAYRINGKDARARDVQLLFADAATGARSSALVRQGRISEIISAKPVQRRAVLEDAAGISGLHSRRHEAELKLNAAEMNLERLDDVMTEIAAQHEALKRQARQAVRYRNISADIRRTQALLFLLRHLGAGKRLEEAEASLREAVLVLADAATTQAAASREEAAAGERLPQLREKAAEAGAALQHIKLLAADLDREEERLASRRREIRERIEQAAADLARESEIAAECEAALARHGEETVALAASSAGCAGRLETARERAGEAAAAAEIAAKGVAEAASALAERRAERAARERGLEETAERLRRLDADAERLSRERDDIAAKKEAEIGLSSIEARAVHTDAALAAAEEAARGVEADLRKARAEEEAAAAPWEAAGGRKAALLAEARALADLLDIDRAGRFAPVIDSIAVAPGYEAALAAALGEDLDAAVEDGAPRHWAGANIPDDDPALPPGTRPLAESVSGPPALARRLRQIGVVDPAQGRLLAAALRPGQRLVSRDGALWRWDGFRIAAGAQTSATMRLTQKNRLMQLEGEIPRARAALEAAERQRREARLARERAEQADGKARRALREADADRESARRALVEAERRAGHFGERLSALAAGLERIAQERRAAAEALIDTEQALETAGDTLASEERHRALEDDLAGRRAAAAEAEAEARLIAREEENRTTRLSELAAEETRWRERRERARTRIGELEARREALAAESERLAAAPEGIALRRHDLMHRAAGAEQAAGAASDALAEAENAHNLAFAAVRRALEDLSAAREAKAREEERVSAAAASRAEIVRQIEEAFGVEPEALAGIAGHDPDKPAPAPEALDGRLERLKTERERLGGVNLRAEQEARELEERLDQLTAERTDLEAGVKRLRQAIASLNREGRQRLLAAFDAVNGHFQSLFGQLFGGGDAQLMLTDAEDPLEAGLEIMARPPGKKPQVLSLLSGGEQALTALALIFAVFLTNPAPICVLDEVDAPLDDANVERFCNLLDEMRGRTDTRFIIVTHNPITMARMDRLFGVTMAERGVSQIVSVDLETAERFREAG